MPAPDSSDALQNSRTSSSGKDRMEGGSAWTKEQRLSVSVPPGDLEVQEVTTQDGEPLQTRRSLWSVESGLRQKAESVSSSESAAGEAEQKEQEQDGASKWRQAGLFSRALHMFRNKREVKARDDVKLMRQTEEEKDHIRRAKRTTMILGDDAWVPFWEFGLLTATLYFEISVTLHDVYDNWAVRTHMPLDVLGTLIFFADIIIRLRMAVHVDGVRFEDSRSIIRLYAQTWLVPDLLAALPFDIFCRLLGYDRIGTYLSHLRLLRVLRVPTYFEQVNPEAICARYIWMYYQVVPLCLLVFWTIFALHLFVIIRIGLVHGRSDDPSPSPAATNSTASEDSFLVATYWVMYTVTSVGYGDIDVNGNGEMLWAIFLFAFGVLANGAIIGKLTRMMGANDIKSEKKAKMMETLAVMEYYSIPAALQQEVLAFQNHILQHNVGSSYSQIISGLPASMQQHIGLYVRIKFIMAVPMFSTACAESRVALAEALVNMVYGPGHFIIRAGDIGEEMFFMGHGYADVLAPDGSYLTTIKKGGFFGEVALLVDTTRTASIRALTYCDCFRLDKADFHQILDSYPDFKQHVQEEIRNRQAVLEPQKEPSSVELLAVTSVPSEHVDSEKASNGGGAKVADPVEPERDTSEAPEELQSGSCSTAPAFARQHVPYEGGDHDSGSELSMSGRDDKKRVSEGGPYSGDLRGAIMKALGRKRSTPGWGALRRKQKLLRAGAVPMTNHAEDCDVTFTSCRPVFTRASGYPDTPESSQNHSPAAFTGDRRFSRLPPAPDDERVGSLKSAALGALGLKKPGSDLQPRRSLHVFHGRQPQVSSFRRRHSLLDSPRGGDSESCAPTSGFMDELREFMRRIETRMSNFEAKLSLMASDGGQSGNSGHSDTRAVLFPAHPPPPAPPSAGNRQESPPHKPTKRQNVGFALPAFADPGQDALAEIDRVAEGPNVHAQ